MRENQSRGATISATIPSPSSLRFSSLASSRMAARRLAVDLRDRVVVVKHHRVEAEALELRELPVEGLRLAGRRAVRIGAFAEIPGAEAETIGGRVGHDARE